jgi:hypothetical protein
MFKEKQLKTGRVYYSDKIPNMENLFTTRETYIRGEEPDAIEKNLMVICEYLGISRANLISPTQTHTSHVEISKIGVSDYPDTDALILTNKEQAVYLNFADCTPVIIYDSDNNIGAISHAGWRGTAGRIVPKTIDMMVKNFNTTTKNLYAVIGPSICVNCYNVKDDVINGIKQSVEDYSNLFRQVEDETFVNLKLTNFQQLVESGVSKDNIDICPYCTCCDNDKFFSYRKENGTKNRHSAIIKLR